MRMYFDSKIEQDILNDSAWPAKSLKERGELFAVYCLWFSCILLCANYSTPSSRHDNSRYDSHYRQTMPCQTSWSCSPTKTDWSSPFQFLPQNVRSSQSDLYSSSHSQETRHLTQSAVNSSPNYQKNQYFPLTLWQWLSLPIVWLTLPTVRGINMHDVSGVHSTTETSRI